MSKKVIFVAAGVILVAVIAFFATRQLRSASNDQANSATPAPTIRPKVNLIDIKDRPYVILEPITARNELQLTVQTLPKQASDVEVLLEYDRNKGVQDAVLKSFAIDDIPGVYKLFMGSKSSGGHITYHDDVVGGSLTLTFSGGDETYSLQVPWRYDDTQPRYSELATTDLKFKLVLDEPYRTPKIVVMQSPGLPAPIKGEVLAGPYLVRGVGVMPELTGNVEIRLSEADADAKLYTFDGTSWTEADSTLTDRTVSAAVPLAQAYIVVK